VPESERAAALAALMSRSSDLASASDMLIWPACADFLAPRLLSPVNPNLEVPPVTVAVFLMETGSNMDILQKAIEEIMYTFFPNQPEARDLLQRIRQDLMVRMYETDIVYRAFAFFMEEQLFPLIGIGVIQEPEKLALFKAGWHMYLMAKSELLGDTCYASIECTYVLLSVMRMLDAWAKTCFPREIALVLCGNQQLTQVYPDESNMNMLASITGIWNSPLHNLKRFHAEIFDAFSKKYLLPHLPQPLALPNDPSLPIAPTLLSEFRSQLISLPKRTKKCLIDFPLDRLEFDELKFLKDMPLRQFYPISPEEIQRTAFLDETGQLVPSSTLCFNSIFQIHSQLTNLSWLHMYSSSQAIRPKSGSSVPIRLENLVSTTRLEVISRNLENWSASILQKTQLSKLSMELTNAFYCRLLLDILIKDAEQNRRDSNNGVAKTSLVESDNFLATLYSVCFEIAMFCFDRADLGCNTFPFILDVVGIQTMDCCKLLASAAKLFTPFQPDPEKEPVCRIMPMPPKPVVSFIGLLEERIIAEHMWKPGSAIIKAYNEATQSFFAYVLSTAGPPNQPRMPVQVALSAPDIVVKFYHMWNDTRPRATTSTQAIPSQSQAQSQSHHSDEDSSSAHSLIIESQNLSIPLDSGSHRPGSTSRDRFLSSSQRTSSSSSTSSSSQGLASQRTLASEAPSPIQPPGIHWEAHGIFCKLLRIGCTRIRSICKLIPTLSHAHTLMLQAELAFSQIVTQRLPFLIDRHVDTIAVCSLAAMIALMSDATPNVILPSLLQVYNQLPNFNEFAVHLIPVQQSNDGLVRYLHIWDFYRHVFIAQLGPLFSKFKKATPVVHNYSPSFSKQSPSKKLGSRQSSSVSSGGVARPAHTPSALNQWASLDSIHRSQIPRMTMEAQSGDDGSPSPTQSLPATQSSVATAEWDSPVNRATSGKRHATAQQVQLEPACRRLDFSDCLPAAPAAGPPPSPPAAPLTPTNRSNPPSLTPRRSARLSPTSRASQAPQYLPLIATPPRSRLVLPHNDEEDEENLPQAIRITQAPRKKKTASSPHQAPDAKRSRSD
jgi:hypothetical protein